MSARSRTRSAYANPVLIGATTVLVAVVAVLMAYNANSGLPFVPTFQLRIDTPDAARLVVGNEVREGGERIGQVSNIEPIPAPGERGGTSAQLTVQLDEKAIPIPDDTTALIRARSTLGLKYVELRRGTSPRALEENAVISVAPAGIAPELDDFFDVFDERTRDAVQENLTNAGAGFAGRGPDLNRAFAALPDLLGDLAPVARTLARPDTGLRTFIAELADFARLTAPVADSLARGFGLAADTFDALTPRPGALEELIAESPLTLEVGIRELPRQRPLLRALTSISGDVRASARAIRAEAPAISRALASGTRVLPRTPPLSDDLRTSLVALRGLAAAPTTNQTIDGLRSTTATLNPTLRYLGPHITVCNYFNLFWTYLADHLSETVPSGTLQRIQVKSAPLTQDNTLAEFGATAPANGGEISAAERTLLGDPVELHAQPYGRAVDEQGNADCEQGQRGYPERLADEAPPEFKIAVDPRTPGSQGPTFTGRPRVPEGQTFSAEPDGLGPKVTP